MKVKIAVVLTLALLLLAGYWLVQLAQPVHAADKPDNCELVGTTGAIVIFFCEPDNGPAFLVNNVGFMQVVE